MVTTNRPNKDALSDAIDIYRDAMRPFAYVRNAGPAQDSIYTFIQALTQSVRRSNDAVLVITLPESQSEAGGEGGVDILDHHVSVKHLGRYTAEFSGRHNRRPLDTADQMESMVTGGDGKQLRYEDLIGPKDTRLGRAG